MKFLTISISFLPLITIVYSEVLVLKGKDKIELNSDLKSFDIKENPAKINPEILQKGEICYLPVSEFKNGEKKCGPGLECKYQENPTGKKLVPKLCLEIITQNNTVATKNNKKEPEKDMKKVNNLTKTNEKTLNKDQNNTPNKTGSDTAGDKSAIDPSKKTLLKGSKNNPEKANTKANKINKSTNDSTISKSNKSELITPNEICYLASLTAFKNGEKLCTPGYVCRYRSDPNGRTDVPKFCLKPENSSSKMFSTVLKKDNNSDNKKIELLSLGEVCLKNDGKSQVGSKPCEAGLQCRFKKPEKGQGTDTKKYCLKPVEVAYSV